MVNTVKWTHSIYQWKSLLVQKARAYPSFHRMKCLRVLLLSSGWDARPSPGWGGGGGVASPSQGPPPPPPLLSISSGFPNNSPVPIYTPGWREAWGEWSVLPKNTTQRLRQVSNPNLTASCATISVTLHYSACYFNLTTALCCAAG